MKKVVLVFGVATLCSVGLNAQTLKTVSQLKGNQKATLFTGDVMDLPAQEGSSNRAVLWQNDFSTAADWAFGTAASQGTWAIGTNASISQLTSYMGQMQSATAANGFAYFNGVQYVLNSSALAQDCWVVTDQAIDLSGAAVITVEFQQRYRAFNVDQTFVELSLDGGATWISREVNQTVPTNSTTTATQAINFDLAGGSANVKLRFRWVAPLNPAGAQYSSGYGWMVDDIKISDAAVNNIVLTKINPGIYTKFPVGQEQRPITFSGKVLNDGSAAQTGVTLSVTANGTAVGSSASVNLAPFATDSLVLTTDYTPSGLGVKRLVFRATQNETDELPANNTMNDSIAVTASTFSRDNNIYAGGGFANFTFGGNPVLGVGTIYELIEPANATSINVVFTTAAQGTTAGSTIQAVILDANLDPVAESDFYTIPASSIPTATGTNPVSMKMNFFNMPVPLAAGEYLIGVRHEGGGVSVAYVPGLVTSDVLVLLDDATQGLNWFGATNGVNQAMIRLNLNEAGAGIKENLSANVAVFPNPTSEVLNISLSDVSGMTTVKIFNMNGQEVYSEKMNVGTSTFIKTVDVSGFAAGMYNIKISSGQGVYNQKVAIN